MDTKFLQAAPRTKVIIVLTSQAIGHLGLVYLRD